MRILFISDIHGYTKNLDILKKEKFDKLVILGDVFGNNKEIYDFLISNKDNLLCFKGNCDSTYIFKELNISFIEDYFNLNVDGLNIYCTHGNHYNYNNLSFWNEANVVIYGHEHVPYIKKDGKTIYICVGSISFPRYGSNASYCIYENRHFTIYSINGTIIDYI